MLNIARNAAIDRTRSKEAGKDKKTKSIETFVNRDNNPSYEEDFVDRIGVGDLVNKLQEEHRFVIEYLYFRGYSQSELAEEFNIPLGTVKTRLRLAIKALRNITAT